MYEYEYECDCMCHMNEHAVHCAPCCIQCQYCGKNIVTFGIEEHKEKCAPIHSLDVELGHFDKHREEWCKDHTGQIALIKGVILKGFYDTYRDALIAGYDEFGVVSFLLKEVRLVDKIEYILSPLSVEFLDEHSPNP